MILDMSADIPEHKSDLAKTALYDTDMPHNLGANLKAGRVVGENFSLIERLGKGGMGEAWKAFDETADRLVVLKFISDEIQNVQEVIATVRSSFKKIHALQHQHICPCYGLSYDDDNGLYTTMKFIDGLTLDIYRNKVMSNLKSAVSAPDFNEDDEQGIFPFDDAVHIFGEVADALDYAHAKKVIHRDIKPQNIMISPVDGVQIIDFGLAEEIRTTMTMASQVKMPVSGTRLYMSPEQWKGRYQDARADQYALAVTVYEVFCGRLPFFSTDIGVLRECVLNEEPEPIPGLPDHANAAIRRALSKNREDRFENCKSFIDALTVRPMTAGINQPSPIPQRPYVSRFALPDEIQPNEFKSWVHRKSSIGSTIAANQPVTTPPVETIIVHKNESSPFLLIAILNVALVLGGIVTLLLLFNPFAKPVQKPETNVTQPPEPTAPVQEPAANVTQPLEPTTPVQEPAANVTQPPEPTAPVQEPAANVTQSPEPTKLVREPEISVTQLSEPAKPVPKQEASVTPPPKPAKPKPGIDLSAQGWKEITPLTALLKIPQTGDAATHHWYLVKNAETVAYEKTENNVWKLNVQNKGLSSGLYIKSHVFEGGIDTVTLKIRASKDANIRIALYDSDDVWGNAEKVVLLKESLTANWQTFSFLLAPKKNQDVLKITGLTSGTVYEIEAVDWKPSPKSRPINKQEKEQKNYDTVNPIRDFKW
ncbi:hypothetical protein FACS1894189_3210 [Planctomycetales bacterium]|nr:hypothetical protein FACS1894189_3210 [Planctomycetales bacterium]